MIQAGYGYAFLRDRQWDAEHGGWYWKLDRGGNVTAETKGVKHAYGIGFGIYVYLQIAHPGIFVRQVATRPQEQSARPPAAPGGVPPAPPGVPGPWSPPGPVRCPVAASP